MATAQEIYRKHKPEAFQPSEHPSRFEVFWWFFMRISGVVLVFLVLIHLYVMHLSGEGVDQVDFAFVAERWESLGWKTFDWSMLFLAVLHGTNGLRVVIDDYVHNESVKASIKAVLYAMAAVLLVMGTMVLVTFDPTAST